MEMIKCSLYLPGWCHASSSRSINRGAVFNEVDSYRWIFRADGVNECCAPNVVMRVDVGTVIYEQLYLLDGI